MTARRSGLSANAPPDMLSDAALACAPSPVSQICFGKRLAEERCRTRMWPSNGLLDHRFVTATNGGAAQPTFVLGRELVLPKSVFCVPPTLRDMEIEAVLARETRV